MQMPIFLKKFLETVETLCIVWRQWQPKQGCQPQGDVYRVLRKLRTIARQNIWFLLNICWRSDFVSFICFWFSAQLWNNFMEGLLDQHLHPSNSAECLLPQSGYFIVEHSLRQRAICQLEKFQQLWLPTYRLYKSKSPLITNTFLLV